MTKLLFNFQLGKVFFSSFLNPVYHPNPGRHSRPEPPEELVGPYSQSLRPPWTKFLRVILFPRSLFSHDSALSGSFLLVITSHIRPASDVNGGRMPERMGECPLFMSSSSSLGLLQHVYWVIGK